MKTRDRFLSLVLVVAVLLLKCHINLRLYLRTSLLSLYASERFDSKYYLEANPDVCKAGLNPLWHYLHNGHREGRLPLPPNTGKKDAAPAAAPAKAAPAAAPAKTAPAKPAEASKKPVKAKDSKK